MTESNWLFIRRADFIQYVIMRIDGWEVLPYHPSSKFLRPIFWSTVQQTLFQPMKKIGILAFGSLIRDRGKEIGPLVVDEIETKTPFGVEYGRYSHKTRGGAPTLVPHSKGEPVDSRILVLDASVSVKAATDMLWRRETGERDKTKEYPSSQAPGSVQVRQLEPGLAGVNTILYTDFLDADKIAEPNEDALAKAAIESVAKAKPGTDGITYLIEAIEDGVETNLTSRYKAAILSKTGSSTLEESLQKQGAKVNDPNAEKPQSLTVQPIESGRKPDIESVQKDIEQGNKYRLELLKHLLTVPAAVLAFTVSFRPTLTHVELAWLMWTGWIALGVSSSCGMLHMLLWSHFYLSYRDYEWHGKDGKPHRKVITRWRRLVMFFQFTGFAIGVLAIAVFAAFNFQNASPPK